jgi:hypothetical protein
MNPKKIEPGLFNTGEAYLVSFKRRRSSSVQRACVSTMLRRVLGRKVSPARWKKTVTRRRRGDGSAGGCRIGCGARTYRD